MKIGDRIIFDQNGNILVQLGQMQGDVLPRKEITELNYIDLEYGEVDYLKYKIISIDITTKRPVLKSIEIPKTEEQLRIEELENQLLLMSDALI